MVSLSSVCCIDLLAVTISVVVRRWRAYYEIFSDLGDVVTINFSEWLNVVDLNPVSYTHLTLPTKA